MKRTANKFQRAYMVAKARVQEVESQQEAIEKKFIADKGIVNPDGSVPEFLYCMEDDAAFEKANDECAALIVSAGLEEELNAARSVLKAAEDSLIAYGLSLAPAGVRPRWKRPFSTTPQPAQRSLTSRSGLTCPRSARKMKAGGANAACPSKETEICMNKIRRKALQEIFDKLSALSDELESIKEEEDESRENMPESLQGSERYEQSESASYSIDEAIESISSACDSIESAME